MWINQFKFGTIAKSVVLLVESFLDSAITTRNKGKIHEFKKMKQEREEKNMHKSNIFKPKCHFYWAVESISYHRFTRLTHEKKKEDTKEKKMRRNLELYANWSIPFMAAFDTGFDRPLHTILFSILFHVLTFSRPHFFLSTFRNQMEICRTSINWKRRIGFSLNCLHLEIQN